MCSGLDFQIETNSVAKMFFDLQRIGGDYQRWKKCSDLLG